jgi:hypothetical protein
MNAITLYVHSHHVHTIVVDLNLSAAGNASQGSILRFIVSMANDPERFEAMMKEKEVKEAIRRTDLAYSGGVDYSEQEQRRKSRLAAARSKKYRRK